MRRVEVSSSALKKAAGVYCDGMRSRTSRQAHPHPSGNSIKSNTRIGGMKIGWVYEKRAEVSRGWRGVCCFGCFRPSAWKCINREFFSCI